MPPHPERSRRPSRRIVVVGGGASAVLLLAALSTGPRTVPVEVTVLDRDGDFGSGRSYRTDDDLHLLNAPADRLGIHAEVPDGFASWVARRGPDGGDAAPYLPRRLYGEYLRDQLHDLVREAGSTVHLRRAEVVDVRSGVSGLVVHTATGSTFDADDVVLAVGDLPPCPPAQLAGHPAVVPDPWAAGALDVVRPGEHVLILGTGLTMVDVANTLAARGARITAVSRSGLLPRRHRSPAQGAPRLALALDGCGDAATTMATLGAAVRAEPRRWREVVDAARGQIPAVWSRWSAVDRSSFLLRHRRDWELHRHRMPPASAERLAARRREGGITVRAGRLAGAVPEGDVLRVVLADDRGGEQEELVHRLVCATGAGRAHGLVDRLARGGLLRRDDLELGIATDASGRALAPAGGAAGAVWVLGPLRRADEWESTAIPEIRAQAARLVAALDREVVPCG